MANTKLEQLAELLIQVTGEYNRLNPEKKVVIKYEKKDVRDVCVCSFVASGDDNVHVGLFRATRYSTTDKAGYILYKGIGSDYTAIRQLRNDGKTCDQFVAGVNFLGWDIFSDCTILNYMFYDDMRLMMFQDNKIEPYELGKATSEEMPKVLAYASEYYKSKQENPMQKVNK